MIIGSPPEMPRIPHFTGCPKPFNSS